MALYNTSTHPAAFSSVPTSLSSSSDILPDPTRPPPPAEWKWTQAAVTICPSVLPPLPRIKDPALAFQARASKDYFVFLPGQENNDDRRNELRSYRPLEWLGDGELHGVFTRELYKRFPATTSGVLSRLRTDIVENPGWSYISRAYGLDKELITPPTPRKPSPDYRPLIQSQKLVADLLEAHMGGLLEEGRGEEVERWVRRFLDAAAGPVSQKHHEIYNWSIGLNPDGSEKKRSREEGDEGVDGSPTSKRPHLDLPFSCPAPMRTTLRHYQFKPQPKVAALWHTHLVYRDKVVACGVHSKKQTAMDDAMARFLEEAEQRGELMARGDLTAERLWEGNGVCAA